MLLKSLNVCFHSPQDPLSNIGQGCAAKCWIKGPFDFFDSTSSGVAALPILHCILIFLLKMYLSFFVIHKTVGLNSQHQITCQRENGFTRKKKCQNVYKRSLSLLPFDSEKTELSRCPDWLNCEKHWNGQGAQKANSIKNKKTFVFPQCFQQ